jgi:hypothetical protein
MPKKLQPIDYTSRDFDSIRRDLEDFAKRYYPNTYRDFNEASFGSLMLDTVAYVGDILSFYLDYQANESFLETAIEYDNVVRLARQVGLKLNTSPSSQGVLTFYIQVPSEGTTLGPNLGYAPILRAGSTFSSTGGGVYTLLEDVDFAQTTNQVVPGVIDTSTQSPSNYVLRAQGRAVSGRTAYREVKIDNFERFLRVPLRTQRVAEVISVIDSEGHEYFEVDHLTQNVIYKSIPNSNTSTNNTVRNILKASPVARRFTVEKTANETYLQFGYGSDSELLSDSVADPTSVVLDLHGRDYTTDAGFDPTKLISTDKFGIAPSNTTLRVHFRINTVADVNAAVNTIVEPSSPIINYRSQGALSPAIRTNVNQTLEVTNEYPFVGDISLPSSDEIKQRAIGYYATQHRAVTAQDYQFICYGMPEKFGLVKRAAVVRDFGDFKRNLNIYVISENTSGKLTIANGSLKNNLRNWLLQYKMMNDTIDILDATIVNFGINYVITLDSNTNRYTALNQANFALRQHLSRYQYDIGERILISDFYRALRDVDGIVDVVNIEIVPRTGGAYSDASYDYYQMLTPDGTKIMAQKNSIFELKFPNIDIKGSIK